MHVTVDSTRGRRNHIRLSHYISSHQKKNYHISSFPIPIGVTLRKLVVLYCWMHFVSYKESTVQYSMPLLTPFVWLILRNAGFHLSASRSRWFLLLFLVVFRHCYVFHTHYFDFLYETLNERCRMCASSFTTCFPSRLGHNVTLHACGNFTSTLPSYPLIGFSRLICKYTYSIPVCSWSYTSRKSLVAGRET